FLLIAAFVVLVTAVGAALNLLFGNGPAFVLVALVIAGGTAFLSYWKADAIALSVSRAKPASVEEYPRLHNLVEGLCIAGGLPKPRIYVVEDPSPNAFATGRNPKHAAVAVTEGLIAVCTWEEIEGVLAHEISHVGNRDILIGSVAAAVATGISFIANMAMWGAMFGGNRDREGGNPIVLLVTALVAPIAAGLLQMALSRSREFEADRTGAALLGTGEPLARALEKLELAAGRIPMDVPPTQASAYIVNPLTGRKISGANLFRTHPTTEERVRRLRAAASPIS
ncbi:MAG: zinc metalloprotease HtpX, partial [Acidimicrobiales bacterium]|nr:zinc metalloprotease HtpX [Acidimicrobiales bacterium]